MSLEIAPNFTFCLRGHTLLVTYYTLPYPECPFLDNDQCSIYPDRPLACRAYPFLQKGWRHIAGLIGPCPAYPKPSELDYYQCYQKFGDSFLSHLKAALIYNEIFAFFTDLLNRHLLPFTMPADTDYPSWPTTLYQHVDFFEFLEQQEFMKAYQGDPLGHIRAIERLPFEAVLRKINKHYFHVKIPKARKEQFKLLGVADDQLKAQNYAKALQSYQKATLNDPNDEQGWRGVGRAARKLSKYAMAIKAFKSALKTAKTPEWTASWDLYELGLCHFYLNEYGKAIEVFTQSTQADRWNLDAWLAMGIAYERLHEYEKEIECCKRILAIHPKDPDALYNLAGAYMYLKDYQKAIPFLQKVLAGNPLDSQALNNLAVCYQNLGDTANFKRIKRQLDNSLKGKVLIIKNPDDSVAPLLAQYGIHLGKSASTAHKARKSKQKRPSRTSRPLPPRKPRRKPGQKPQFNSKHHKKRRDQKKGK